MEGKEYFGKGLCVVCGLCFSKLHLAQYLHLSSKGLPVVIARYLFSFYLVLQLRNFNLDIQFHGGLFSLLCSLGALILKAFIIFFCSVPLMFNCIISMKCIVHIFVEMQCSKSTVQSKAVVSCVVWLRISKCTSFVCFFVRWRKRFSRT